ncbi:putative late blight resistance protein homolog R1B-16 [Salvia miltiorrhiza]|uniref:putative late blight resistance protein homolog R1B-16 n=1 Tax=Salvia miltiorrhiza TaxID=226208 RepID=UPI0025AD291B|nr:putative late blight resistance protein homolog R1B-16 [Salvia miltiorrhiza]
MAAYAALVSVMNVIDALQRHPRPPISLHNKQVESLTQKLTFLQQFLEGYNPHLGYTTETDPLESRIADAAYAAEDVIESHIVDQINNGGKKMSFIDLYQALHKVIEEMALIEKEAMEVKQTQNQLHTESTPSDSVRSASIFQKKSRMVGADDVLLQMKDMLTSDRLHLQIIPIVGMGGSGKTTLAINIYQDPLIKEHFHICAWVTISQEYSFRDMLIEVLSQLTEEVDKHLSEDVLGEILYKHLFGRKYLIIMDDMWSIEAWEGVKSFLPNNKNGSRVVVTTRLSNLASTLPNSSSLEMKLLDEDDSWDLLSKTVFGENGCPLELEKIGKKIGKGCKGLPLSIVVVGGLLAKSKHTREFWESIEENLNSIVNLEDDERCLKLLHMSYKQLPIHLKPCFLYMGVFHEDEEIFISKLVKLWVAEGFLKPVSGKSLDETAELYLKDLIDRNLVLSHELDSIGSLKKCKIHDLLRDLCLREAEKERFYTLTPQGIANAAHRRIVISKNEDINALPSMSSELVRSLTLKLDDKVLPPLSLRLLRILNSCKFGSIASVQLLGSLDLVNLRFLAISPRSRNFKLPCSISLFWNLQTLVVENIFEITEGIDIWCMPHIRHVQFRSIRLSDPPKSEDAIVLGSLQTLRRVDDFKCSQQVVKRISNIKRLHIVYCQQLGDHSFCLSNLHYLDKLEYLDCRFHFKVNPSGPNSLKREINFPHSLKKLTLLISEDQCWKDMLDKIGVLPLLEKLKLIQGSFKDERWETTEGHFQRLKFLRVHFCKGLRVWTIESSHFPCLEHLDLNGIVELNEIPLDFAEISTLRVIDVYRCSDSAVRSAKRILEEQEELYGEEALQVQVTLSSINSKALESLASPNFRVTHLQN